jgi:NAD(P)-dependent dehydrogenase (short-subunit alcohol dehydrogenase family)
MRPWTTSDIPSFEGRVVVVTGANSGLGLETSLALAGAGAQVVLACRNLDRGSAAVDQIVREVPGARAELAELDLADLASVHQFAAVFSDRHAQLDVLINNAGLMGIPRKETIDGFEMQFGTNHLGHFALTGLLLDRLVGTPGARVVTVASMAARIGRMRWDDLQLERHYNGWTAYGQSKLANQLFALELDRRLAIAGSDVLSVAAHPGYAATNLAIVSPQSKGSGIGEWLARVGNASIAQSAAAGALPTLYAATSPDVRGGQFFGPDGLLGMRGNPTQVSFVKSATNTEAARRLWTISEGLTGVRFKLSVGVA